MKKGLMRERGGRNRIQERIREPGTKWSNGCLFCHSDNSIARISPLFLHVNACLIKKEWGKNRVKIPFAQCFFAFAFLRWLAPIISHVESVSASPRTDVAQVSTRTLHAHDIKSVRSFV